MNIIFQINGGLGKHIAATAVCKAIKAKYPDSNLIVISGYPEVFLNNPYVDRSFSFYPQNYFYDEYIKGKDVMFLIKDPYHQDSYIKQSEHLIPAWTHMFDIPYNGEVPELYLSAAEQRNADHMLLRNKPLLFFQPFGGGYNQSFAYSWNRDLSLSFAQQLVDKLCKDFSVIHIKHKNQLCLQNTVKIDDLNYRTIFALLTKSTARLCIDSFLQHASAALSLPSVVCWITNKPESLGYSLHENITPNVDLYPSDGKYSMFSPFSFGGEDQCDCPFTDLNEIFDIDEIIQRVIKYK